VSLSFLSSADHDCFQLEDAYLTSLLAPPVPLCSDFSESTHEDSPVDSREQPPREDQADPLLHQPENEKVTSYELGTPENFDSVGSIVDATVRLCEFFNLHQLFEPLFFSSLM
jgi:hypothetical protein